MIRRTSLILLEVTAIAVGAVGLLGAVMAWQLSRGPMEISLLNHTVEDMVNSVLPGGHLSISKTMLDWSSPDRELVIRLDDAVFSDENDNAVATVPQLALQLSIPALLKGRIAPADIELIGPSLTLTRETGGLSFGLSLKDRSNKAGETGKDAESSFVSSLIEALAREPDTSPLGYLSRVAIHDATLRFHDAVNDVTLEAKSAVLVAYRSDQGVSALYESDIITDEGVSHLVLTGRMRHGAPRLNMQARFWNVVPAALARLSPAFSDYGSIDAPVDGTARLVVLKTGSVQEATLALDIRPGKIVAPLLQATPITVDKAHLDLELDALKHVLTIRSANFQAQGNKATLAGDVSYVSGKGLNIDQASVNLNATDITLSLPSVLAGQTTLDNVAFKGAVDFRTSEVTVNRLHVGHGEMDISLAGDGRYAGAARAARVTGSIDRISIRELLALWPLEVAKDARDWVADSMPAGFIPTSRLSVNLTPQMIARVEAGKPLPNEAVSLAFDVRDAAIIYVKEQPPITGADGNALLQADRFEGWVNRGVVRVPSGGVITASNGYFRTDDFALKDAPGVINTDVAGATPDILELLDMKPFGYITLFGLNPRVIGGKAAGHLMLSIPLSKHVKLNQVKVSAQVKASGLTLPNVSPDLNITGGTLDLDVTQDDLKAKGEIRLNDVPLMLDWHQLFQARNGITSTYRISGTVKSAARKALGLDTGDALTGPVAIDATLVGNGAAISTAHVSADLTQAQISIPPIGWRKKPGEKAHVSTDILFPKENSDGPYQITNLMLDGDGVAAQGVVDLGKTGALQRADVRGVKLGPKSDFDLTAEMRPDGVTAIHLKGRSFDAEPLLMRLGKNSGDDTHDQTSMPVDIKASLDEVHGVNDAILTDVCISLSLREDKVHLLNLTGADQRGGHFMAILSRQADGTRKLDARADDAGALARATGLYDNIQGGALEASGIIDDGKQGSPMSGIVTVRNFRVVKAPVLANILTLGSFTGIRDTLSGDGVFFEELKLPYRMTDMRYYLDSGRAVGPAMGISVSGSVDREGSVLDLEGTITPAYFLNSFLGRIPLIGPWIVGREGEGLFAFTYAVRGPISDPDVSVNPLSAFAPGFLRRIFEYSTSLANKSPDPDLLPMTSNVLSPLPRQPGE